MKKLLPLHLAILIDVSEMEEVFLPSISEEQEEIIKSFCEKNKLFVYRTWFTYSSSQRFLQNCFISRYHNKEQVFNLLMTTLEKGVEYQEGNLRSRCLFSNGTPLIDEKTKMTYATKKEYAEKNDIPLHRMGEKYYKELGIRELTREEIYQKNLELAQEQYLEEIEQSRKLIKEVEKYF